MDESVNKTGAMDKNMSTPSKNPEETPKATPSIIDVINVVADRVEPIVKIVHTFAETSLKTKQSDSHFRIHMAWIAVAVVGIIVGVATILTFSGKMDGSTYGFLLGSIMGYARMA